MIHEQGPPLPARWYVVSRDGLATLCKDHDDAQDTAASCFVQWPLHAPYRVVLLGDVVAERERAAQIGGQIRNAALLGDWHTFDALLEALCGPSAGAVGAPIKFRVGALRIRQALSKIARLRSALQQIASTKGYGTDGPCSKGWVHWVSQAQSALDAS